MMEDGSDSESDSESSVIPDSEPEEGLLAMPAPEESFIPQELQDFREMFEGTQPSFMDDTTLEDEGYTSAASSVQGQTDSDLGDSDSEHDELGWSSKKN